MKTLKHTKAITLIAMVLLVILFSSCNIKINIGEEEKELNEWSRLNDAFYKQDVNSSTGQLCMVYDNRIYYISDESGESGVHSMDLDGNNIEFLIQCNRSTKMIIHDDMLYLVTRYLNSKTKTDIYYHVESHDISCVEPKIEPIDFFAESVIDLTVCENGELFMFYMKEGEYPKKNIFLGNFSDSSLHTAAIAKKELPELQTDDLMEYIIEVYNDYIICIYKYIKEYESGKWMEVGNGNDSIYNIQTGEILINEIYDYTEIKVVYASDEYIYLYCYGFEDLFVYERDTLELYKKIAIDGVINNEQIYYTFKMDNYMYFVSTENSTHERIISLNLETDETSEIFKNIYETDSKKLINIQDNCILYADDNKIYYQEIDGTELGKMRFEMSFDENIINNNVFEVAGDWLFIHSKGEPMDNDAYELLYKINLVN